MSFDQENESWAVRSVDEIIALGFEEALEVAKDEISKYSHAGVFESGPVWTETWYALGLDYSTEYPDLIEIPKKSCEELVRRAQKHQQAFELLTEVISGYINHWIEPPAELKQAAVNIVKGVLVRPKRARGEPDPGTWARDHMILHVGKLLEDRYELNLTRNEEGDGLAASDIIFHALGPYTDLTSRGSIQSILTKPKKKELYVKIRFDWIDSLFD
ncbi:hypothetical protein [Ruegeria sp. PrR005]|uniref:Uncharacterized protein n=1 Tax=Ruegeria sp. PrR005 TaxID=2706882 RepID=A0A6B2NRZ9_9RHOB|nr:hypothetical protein [Ruegeria sp. PrR005]NDW45279.1 hypothetical protein [Ruegeria sp. PrR005]